MRESAIVCNPQDQQALLKIKSHFQNPPSFSNWIPITDCCQWRNVQCNNDLRPDRVNFLFLDGLNDISGTVPDAVGDLAYLNVLQFSKLPILIGPIPDSVTKLSNLQVLVIKENKNVSGRIPEFLSKVKSVLQLDLSSNAFSGSIPSSLSMLPNV
ncbi:polygalacturonase inhibitor 2-like [Amaranthus tricolor]|uniref:polygalacturonase inhibitor 2-like n=1 Tax=Amaranthus tricolor TaxID=29722 RepID=UPI002583A0AE|nr:polygalacturonase inhibitor 2-like [Amaranthus tricolor]